MKQISIVILALWIGTGVSAQSKKVLKEFRENFASVGAGKVMVDGDSTAVGEFLMSKTEITNKLYRHFYLEVLNGKDAAIKAALAAPDTGLWQFDAMKNFYFSHPAYADYPVCAVSQQAALMFCEWLTEKYGAALGDEYYFDLPTRPEWIKAANGKGNGPFAWGGPYLRNSKGMYLCNFKVVGEQRISYNGQEYKIMHADNLWPDESIIFTPVKSYWPNGYGLYNMNGNVAEWVKEPDIAVGGSYLNTGYDVRNQSIRKVAGSATDVGFRVVARKK